LKKPNSSPPPKEPPNKFYNVKTSFGPSLKKEEPHNNTSYDKKERKKEDMVTKQNKHILTFC
jgi:hypothetical protein